MRLPVPNLTDGILWLCGLGILGAAFLGLTALGIVSLAIAGAILLLDTRPVAPVAPAKKPAKKPRPAKPVQPAAPVVEPVAPPAARVPTVRLVLAGGLILEGRPASLSQSLRNDLGLWAEIRGAATAWKVADVGHVFRAGGPSAADPIAADFARRTADPMWSRFVATERLTGWGLLIADRKSVLGGVPADLPTAAAIAASRWGLTLAEA